MGEFALGQAVPRFEDPRLLRGGGRYVDDMVLPRMVLPTPGTPVMPTRSAAPVKGNSRVSRSSPRGAWRALFDSISVNAASLLRTTTVVYEAEQAVAARSLAAQ